MPRTQPQSLPKPMKQIGSSGLDLSWMMGVNLLLAPLSSTLAWGHTVLSRDFVTHSRTCGRPPSTTGRCLKSRTVLLDLGQVGGTLSCRRHRHKLCKCYQLSTDCPLCVCITGVGLCSHNGFFLSAKSVMDFEENPAADLLMPAHYYFFTILVRRNRAVWAGCGFQSKTMDNYLQEFCADFRIWKMRCVNTSYFSRYSDDRSNLTRLNLISRTP